MLVHCGRRTRASVLEKRNAVRIGTPGLAPHPGLDVGPHVSLQGAGSPKRISQRTDHSIGNLLASFERLLRTLPLERCSLSKKPRRSEVEGRREQHSFVMALWLVPEPLTEGSLFAVRYSCSVQVVPD